MGKLTHLYWKATTVAARVLAKHLYKIQLGHSLRAMGMPIFDVKPGSQMKIGDKVVLCSDPKGTALGVARPVILRTLTPTASLVIGNDCGASGAVICAAQEVTIGDRCLIGADVKIFDTDFHPHAPDNRRYTVPDWDTISKPVSIGRDVFLGTGAIICKGVCIGDGAIVAAGSIVVSDVPENTVVAGNPAKPVKVLS